MEAENNDQASKQRQQEAERKYLEKLMPIIKHHGLSRMKVDDIVRAMDISKATFYKHFISKEEVIECVVDVVVGYLQQASTRIGDPDATYLQRFQHVFTQSLLLASYLSDAFLLDLKQFLPLQWERVRKAQQERQRQLQQFYEQGIATGVFRPLSPALAVLQDELLLRNIMDPIFLMEHDLTLRKVLYDYYELQKYQWLSPEVSQQLDDAPVKEYIEMMARKISLGMRSE